MYGRQPFLPVGAPAVNSGVQRGRGHSLYGAVAASRSCFACSAAWELAAARVRAARSNSPTGALPPGSSGMLRPSVGNRLTAVRWPPAALSGGYSTSAGTWATVMLSRASTTRHRLNPRRVGSGRDWTVRASAPQDQELDRSPGIPGVAGTRITPPGLLSPRLLRSSSMASMCSPFSGAAPPPSGSRRPGCGTGFPGSGRNRSTWRPGTPPPSGFAPAGWVHPAGASRPGRPAISAREDAMPRPH